MLTARARSLFPSYIDPATVAPALRAVAIFAAQNPGFDFGNYVSPYDRGETRARGVSAYRADSRRATRDLQRCRQAMRGALRATDAEVVEASRRAFSGRLSLEPRADGSVRVDYCTGQYWPTEYRAAVAAVLDQVSRELAQGSE